ncbi:MAG: ribonuclease P protein component [Marinoscillum sp.]|jgi:ribonuclease P protein component
MSERGHSFTFPKKEKLTGKKTIEELFKNGSSFYLHPIKVKYIKESDPTIDYHRILFSVPKRSFKRAVDRNLLKRRMREAYRLHKALILNGNLPAFYQIAFIYLDKSALEYAVIEEKLTAALQRLSSRESGQSSPLT